MLTEQERDARIEVYEALITYLGLGFTDDPEEIRQAEVFIKRFRKSSDKLALE